MNRSLEEERSNQVAKQRPSLDELLDDLVNEGAVASGPRDGDGGGGGSGRGGAPSTPRGDDEDEVLKAAERAAAAAFAERRRRMFPADYDPGSCGPPSSR